MKKGEDKVTLKNKDKITLDENNDLIRVFVNTEKEANDLIYIINQLTEIYGYAKLSELYTYMGINEGYHISDAEYLGWTRADDIISSTNVYQIPGGFIVCFIKPHYIPDLIKQSKTYSKMVDAFNKLKSLSIADTFEFDIINHPNHYQSETGLEVIDVIKAFTADLKGIEAVYTGNIIKYICRWNKKNGVEDLGKAKWYLDHLIELKSK